MVSAAHHAVDDTAFEGVTEPDVHDLLTFSRITRTKSVWISLILKEYVSVGCNL